MRNAGCFLLATGLLVAPGVAQIRVVNYNTLDGPTPGVHDNSANMQTIFTAMAGNSVNGIAKRPDLLILQEQTNTSAAALATILNTQFSTTAYVAITPSGQPSSSDPKFIDRQSFVYDSSTLNLLGTAISVPTGALRPVIRGQFRPVGYSSVDASFYAYGAHLMSSDPTGRSNQTSAMRANSDALGAVHAIYAGDFNMQNNQEAAWQNLFTGAGQGLAVDPLNPTNAAQTWNNNAAFASIHTQSTRTGATPDGDGGATGGMDDRFDVQLSTQEFQDGEGLSLIPGSYRAFGNDGQHFNASINASPTIPLGATVANALWDASDHLPVVADYQLPAKIGVAISTPVAPTVLVNYLAPAMIRVRNDAPTSVAAGADELDYTLSVAGSGTGGFTTPAVAAAGAVGNLHAVALAGSTPGVKSATFTVNSTSQGVEAASPSVAMSTTVLAHATPSLNAAAASQSRNIDFGIWGMGEIVPGISVAVFNLADPSGFTAGLDIDSIAGSGDTTSLPLANLAGGGAIAGGTSRTGTASLNASAVGAFFAQYALGSSDEDLPGAMSFLSMSINLQGRIALFGDATLDNTVNLDDFTALAAAFGQSGQTWQTGDFTHDGSVDLDDFTFLAAHFGETAAEAPRAVPEPTGIIYLGSIASGALVRSRRRAATATRALSP